MIRAAVGAGESQTALAERLGIRQPTIWGWLNEGAVDPKASVLEAVARTLGVNGHWLLTGDGDKRELSVGGEVIFAAGVEAGLQQAQEAVRALRATSAVPAPPDRFAKATAQTETALGHLEAATQRLPKKKRRKSAG